MKKAMSMIEIIFVIAIIGVLAGVAIPKIFVSRDDAQILKLKETLALIRSGIEQYKQNSLYTDGSSKYPEGLCLNTSKDSSISCNGAKEFFGAVIKNPVKKGSTQGMWDAWTQAHKDPNNQTFIFYTTNSKKGYVFQYNKQDGTFKCLNNFNDASKQICLAKTCALPCKDIGETGYESK